MALSPEVVYFSGLHLRYDVHEVRAIAEVAIVEFELIRVYIDASARDGCNWGKYFLTFVLILIEMLQTAGVEAGRSTNDAMDFIALFEQQLGPGRSGNQRHNV